jgi:hypothetical protein
LLVQNLPQFQPQRRVRIDAGASHAVLKSLLAKQASMIDAKTRGVVDQRSWGRGIKRNAVV